MYAWRDRETVMDLLETLSGSRVHYSANVLGGVKFDVDSAQVVAILKAVAFLEARTHHYLEVVGADASFLQRTRGIGYLPAAQAEVQGVVGPTARASGVLRDVRVEAPYAGYTAFAVQPVLSSAGDLEARCRVRLAELLKTCEVIRAIVGALPPGELTTRMPRKIKAGETISRVEAPRGELFYFIKSNGSEIPERVRVATPTIRNLNAAVALVVGRPLADVPMILAGVDPCFSCNDRMVLFGPAAGRSNRWTWEQLRQHGLAYYSLPSAANDGLRP
jgi:NADH-quinone oxidoreductase subunit D